MAPPRLRTKHLNEDWRAKIQSGRILQRLHDLVDGRIEMPPHAVTAALGLLKKALPDLKQVEVTGSVGVEPVTDAREIAIDRMRAIADRLGYQFIAKPNGAGHADIINDG